MPKVNSLRRRFRYVCLGMLLTVAIATLITASSLWRSSQQSTDAYLVLGGSIRREMYMAQLAGTFSKTLPILVSAGSADPCIRLLFEQAGASLSLVWLEHCAQSTFGNFVYSVPILERLGVRHVTLVNLR